MQLYCIFHKNKTGSTKLPPLSSIIFIFIFIIIFMSLYIFVFIFISSLMVNRQTDGQTDRQTDRQTDSTALFTLAFIFWKHESDQCVIFTLTTYSTMSHLVLSCVNFSFPVFTSCLTLFVLSCLVFTPYPVFSVSHPSSHHFSLH